MKKHTVRFIITIFGNKHIGMLITNIYSILRSNPGSHITVFWQDIEEHIIKAIMKSFETVLFSKTNFDFSSDPIKRISSKTHLWNYAVQKYPNDYLCILDVDTLVIKSIQHFFDQDFDIIYTYKEGQFPLNTGVMLCKGNNYPFFFKLWKEETFKIINNLELYNKANSPQYPYGGADQMSLFKLLCYDPNKKTYEVAVYGQKLVFRGMPCDILNEVHSKNITEKIHIIHYKGWWQKIILEGQNFQKKIRTKRLSWEMYILYLKTFKESLEFICIRTKMRYKPKDFNIVIPIYLNTSTFTEVKCLYFLYSYCNRLISFFKRKIDLGILQLFQNLLHKDNLNSIVKIP
ncbi:MAG: hypothetical protein PVF56_14395 [Desulfobacterales bacterium]|jgi:hypothetical protein